MYIQELRTLRPVLSPREVVKLVVARCSLSRHVLQWQTSAERGPTRLVNLDQLLAYAGDYESDCRASREAATLSGFLLWMKELADAELDHLPGGGADAVQVMTHRAAKGLEWPVVILVDLAGDVRNSLWDSVRAESRGLRCADSAQGAHVEALAVALRPIIEGAPGQRRPAIDLNALAAAAHLKLCGALTFSPREQNPRIAKHCTNSGAKAMQCFVDVAQTLCTGLDRQIGEIDIYRQPRQVADKEVDGGPALECKAGFPADERQQLDQ